MPKNLQGYVIVEDAWFVVVEVLKGSHVVGEVIHTRTKFTPGPCGVNVRNDPPWIYEAGDSSSTEDLRPVAMSATWLIVGWGEQPYDLLDSAPMNVRGDVSLKAFREILDAKEQNGI